MLKLVTATCWWPVVGRCRVWLTRSAPVLTYGWVPGGGGWGRAVVVGGRSRTQGLTADLQMGSKASTLTANCNNKY